MPYISHIMIYTGITHIFISSKDTEGLNTIDHLN